MAVDGNTQASVRWHLLLGFIALVAFAARAEPDLRCPEYVAAHAPLVWLHSDDPFKPSDLLAHIQHTTPQLGSQAIRDLPALDLDNLEILNEYGDRVALTSNDDPTTFPQWIYGEAPDETGHVRNSTPCCVIMVEKTPREVDVFYFYFYSYNEGPNITQVMEPLNRLVSGGKVAAGMHFGDHVGDWEHNMVRFHDGEPVGIYYSQHRGGKGYNWDDPVLTITDGRPTVYSARGSHANYAQRGLQIHDKALLDYCDEGQKWDPILSAYFYRFDPANFTLTPMLPPNQTASARSSSNLTSFFYFDGVWGDVAYPDSDPRQEVVPRFGVKRFQTGPTGPRHKQLVRKGLVPDHRFRESWLEWFVGIYLALYPCCLKGWRAWISTGVIVSTLLTIVLAIKIGMKRYKKRGYAKVHTDDIMLDDWDRDDEAMFSSSDEEDERNHHRK